MHESWPAWGGRTSVGTTRLRETEKSRSRAKGASNAISCGVDHDGGVRRVAVAIHREKSKAAGPRRSAAVKQRPNPLMAVA